MILTLVLSRCQKVYIHPYPIDTGTFVEKADQDFFFFFFVCFKFYDVSYICFKVSTTIEVLVAK